jgi:hypothetical protein
VSAPGFGQGAYQRYIRKKVEREKIDLQGKWQRYNNLATAYQGYGAMAEVNRRKHNMRGYVKYRKLQGRTGVVGNKAWSDANAAHYQFFKDRARCRRVGACK